MAHDVYTALSDPTRRRILSTLGKGARPVGDLVSELEVSQPTVSKHLKVLRDAGLVSTRAEGQRRYYSVVTEPLTQALEWLQGLAFQQDRAHHVDAPSRSVPWLRAEPAQENGTAHEVPEPHGDGSGAHTKETLNESADAEIGDRHTIADRPVPDGQETLHEQAPVTAVVDKSPAERALTDGSEASGEGVTVGNDTDVSSTGESFFPEEAAERDPLSFDAEVPSALGGVPYRRQGGLLSTLSGLRRRGRNPRR